MATARKLSRPASARNVTQPAVTTSIKLPARVKAAITRLAKKEGRTTHGYMLVLLKEGVERATRWQEFLADARAADEEFERTGLAYAAEDVHRYMEEKAQGKTPPPPKLRKWRK